jgi:hypothetical protein
LHMNRAAKCPGDGLIERGVKKTHGPTLCVRRRGRIARGGT